MTNGRQIQARTFGRGVASSMLCLAVLAMGRPGRIQAQPPIQTPSQAPAGQQGELTGDQFRYRGYRFDLGTTEASPALLAALRQQADLVDATPITDATRRFFQGLLVHVALGEGEHAGGGRFSREGVFVSLKPVPDDRPILLHEFLHAYQAERLPRGSAEDELRVFFERARASGLWPQGAYMLSNEHEFFAMTASVFLCGHADRPPFTRAALERNQPLYVEWLRAHVR